MLHAPNRRSVLQCAAALGLVYATPVFAVSRQPVFNVFFDFESAEMSEAATELADRIAQQMLPNARVILAGNADTAEAHPDRISYTRGNTVLKHFLRKPSLSKVRFNVLTNGTSSPLVRTGPNVREPQNRRVEIILDL
jgi:outer membrane protein OmpA-like peptidoglycan-associated protein